MAIQTKVKWAQLRVGILALAALVLVTVLIFLITGKVTFFESKATLYTYLSDAAALTDTAPVNLDGIQIGKVTGIGLSGLKDPKRLVRVKMEVPESSLKNIPVDSEASISSANLLGAKYINIKSGKSEQTVRPGQEIPALNASGFDTLMQAGTDVMSQLQVTVGRIDKMLADIQEGKGNVGKLLTDDALYNKLLATVDQVHQLAAALNSKDSTIGKLVYDHELYDDLHKTLGRVDSLVQGLQEGQGSAGKLLKDPSLFDDAHKTIAGLNKLVDDLNAGQGTAGKLLKSDELHKQLSDSLAKLDLMLDKINSGQGTIGQLMVNPQLYDNLSGATREMHLLMKDFRANPKKFLRIKLGLF
ncbi:MAG TPA: MlaD family protein [Bryobacteraceae bacterium]|nr:MlaD family protein [Bryobacteraceae bacterium]